MNRTPSLKSFIILFILFFTDSFLYPQITEEPKFNRDFYISISKDINSTSDTVKFHLQSSWDKHPGLFNIRIYKINNPEEFYTAQRSLTSWSVIGADSSNLLNYLTMVKSIDTVINFKLLKNWKNEDISHIDEYLNFLPSEKGAYLVKVSYLKKSAYAGFWVTDLALVTQLCNAYFHCFTVNLSTGEISDSVQLNYYLNRKKIAQYECLNGLCNYVFTPEDKKYLTKMVYNKPLIVARKGDDMIVSNPYEYFYFYAGGDYKPYIYTSQPVYKPGSLVEFSGTVRQVIDSGFANLPEHDIFTVIKDSKGTEVYRQILKTNNNGSFSGNYFVEENAPVGSYTILITINHDTAENIAVSSAKTYSCSFTIKEFKNPEFYVEMTTNKEQYSTGEVLTGKISSNYYFGNPVQEAEVKYSIYKQPLYRPWWYFSDYRWFYEGYYSKIMHSYSNSVWIYENSGKLDKNGKFEFNYSIEEDFKFEKYRPNYIASAETDYLYIVNYSVTDKSRRTITGTKTFTVSRAQFALSSTTDKYCYKPGEIVGINTKSLDFSDKPVSASFSATVMKITNVIKNKQSKRKFSFVTTLSGKTYLPGGNGLVHFSPSEEGEYEAEITAFDNDGKKITDKVMFYVFAKNSYWLHENISSTIQIIPEKHEYRTGDTCRLLVITPIPDATLLVTAFTNNYITGRVIKISGNSDYIDIPVEDSYCPNFMVQIAYVNNGMLNRKEQNVIAISGNKFLNIDISSDKPTYKPREEGTITLKVTDNKGQPVKNAELSVGMIDESIYSIAADNTPDIKQNFYSASNISTQSSLYSGYYNAGYTSATYSSIFEMFNFKLYGANELGTIRGRVVNDDGFGISNAVIMINDQYSAAVTIKDGTFEFKIPDGHYTLSLNIGNSDIKGYIDIYSLKSQNSYYEIVTDYLKLFSAKNEKQWDLDIKEYITVQPKSKDAHGSIMGRVIDAKDKTPLAGAIVKIEGSNVGAETDINGEYIITNIKPGTYNLIAVYVGYTPLKFTDVKVKDNVVNVTFELTAGSVMLDTLEIIAQRKGINVDQSGRLISNETVENLGIRGIQNISKETSGVVPGDEFTETFVEAETRSDFKDAMFWTPSVFTDENGMAELKVKFPDNLTTWRITARAITGDTKVAQGKNSVISRKDLIIRMEAPMFFQKDDELTISTVVHNYLTEGKNTKVSLKTENLLLDKQNENEKVIWLDKNEEKRIDWKVKVTEPTGTAKLNASALTNEESDAVEYKVPLQPRGLKINTFSSYSLLDPYKIEKAEFDIPENSSLQTAKITVRITPSVVSYLRTALAGLLYYPYGCIEQTLSRFIPALMVSKVYKDIGAPQDEFFEKKLGTIVKIGFNRVYSMQKTDGGWGWWSNDEADLFMTANAVYSLTLAQKCGYTINNKVYRRGVSNIVSKLKDETLDPALRAFCLFSISSSPDLKKDFFENQFLLAGGEKNNAYVTALLSLTCAQLGDFEKQELYTSKLKNLVSFDDKGAFFGKAGKYYKWNEDIIQSTAFSLKAIIADSVFYFENKELVENIVKWLMTKKAGNGWGSTQQTAFVIYSLTDYVKISNETNPDYMLTVYSNNVKIEEKHITHENVFGNEELVEILGTNLRPGTNEIRFEKRGTGSAYINSELMFYSNNKNLQSEDNGFEITKEYFGLEKFKDYSENVITYKKRPFTGVVTSGDEFLVKIKVVSKTRNPQYFMLEDPIPAGCTNVEEEWAFKIEGEKDYKGHEYYYWRWWYARKELRVNKVAFFATNLYGDEFEFSYILRAQIPGVYNISPTKGQLMYYPDVNGTGKEMKIEIKDK